jgi:mono/diheme cytochrome c family protein
MFEGRSQRSVASSAQHRQEAEVTAAEERERAAVETTATAARATTLAMVELAAAGAEVERGRCSACGGSKA